MIVVIAVLALVVVFMANKPAPGAPGSPLPQPDQIPATGTDGIPSPAKWANPLAGTEAGQVVMDANPVLPHEEALLPPPPMPGGSIVRGVLSVPAPSPKELVPMMGVRTIAAPGKTTIRRFDKL